MQTIPLSKVPSQSLSVTLAGQRCRINVYQKAQGVFIDLVADGVPIITGIVTRDRTKVVRYPALPFVGDLAFADTQGLSDPDYTGFGSRFKLVYIP